VKEADTQPSMIKAIIRQGADMISNFKIKSKIMLIVAAGLGSDTVSNVLCRKHFEPSAYFHAG
jgi:hypothetical protein